ncbi:Transcriptional regulator ADR1 [Escovopsis weberi]|uniref:Transcriptional regulator ADR1 n=1 Tax=Escovopsis weberi TaxID=150374 RepID=A0A0M8MXL8_ESCWE|nr:Transcriptional regulator ADR1 [Escovopsis weberi]
MQMIASTSNASTSRGMHSGHIRHQSLAGLPLHNFDQLLGSVMGMGQRSVHGLPKLETVPLGNDFDSGLHTAPPRGPFAPEFDFEGFLFGAGTTINPNALHYSDSPPSMTLDQTSPFVPAMTDLSAGQVFDDGFDWLSGFEHQMSFQTNDNVMSNPFALDLNVVIVSIIVIVVVIVVVVSIIVSIIVIVVVVVVVILTSAGRLLRSDTGRQSGVGGGSGCLVLAMAAIGALYEMEHTQSKHLFDMTKKMIFFHLEERRLNDVRKADIRRSSQGGTDNNPSPASQDGPAHTPVWLVQALLLNVMYGHNCADQSISDIASTHCAALVSLAEAAELGRREIITSAAAAATADGQDTRMSDDSSWGRRAKQNEQQQWLRWKTMEERKRTLYAVFIVLSLLVATYNHPPALTNSEILLDLPCDEEYFAAESSAAWLARGGIDGVNRNRLKFCDALGDLLRTNEKQQKHLSSLNHAGRRRTSHGQPDLPTTELRPSTFGCLVLINALHNYIWETRQRHHNKVWTSEETEKMHRHIEPALKAWQAAWSGNPHHSLERPNPFGLGPLSADAVPLLDLAYIRLFFNMTRSKEKFWQRDWEGMAEELARGSVPAQQQQQQQQTTQSPSSGAQPHGADMLDTVFFTSDFQPKTTTSTAAAGGEEDDKFPTLADEFLGPSMTRREHHLRKSAAHAADSLAMSYKLGVTFADLTSRELPLQSAMCVFDCAQVLAEWVATLQDRVGRYLGVLGETHLDVSQFPALMLLEAEDVRLLERTREVLASAEMKLSLDFPGGGSGGGVGGVGGGGIDRADMLDGVGGGGFAASILRLTGQMLDKAAVWPVTHLMARCLEAHAKFMRIRAEKSILGSA